MAAPLVISFWMRAAFSLVDTAYAATIGDEAVAAIGLAVPFEFLMIALWVGLSTGLTSCLSRAMGACQPRQIEQYIASSWRFVYGIVPLFLGVGVGIWFWAPHMGLSAGVQRAFQIYGTVLITGSAISAFWSVIPDSIVKAHQDTRSTMWAGIWSNVLNVTLNTVFVFVFHWGVFGIALSTVIGRFGGLAYAVVRAHQHERRRREAWSEVNEQLDTRPYRAILALAVPAALSFVLMSLETAIVNWLLAKPPDSTAAIAAYSIYYRVMLFALNPMIAAAVALLPYAARRFGNRDLAGVRRGLNELALAAIGYAVLLVAPTMVLFGPTIAGWLAESPTTARYAAFALKLVPLVCLASTPFLLCRPVFEGMQRGRPGLIMAVIRYGVLSLPLAWLGMLAGRALGHPGFYGLLIGMLVGSSIASGLFVAWLLSALRAMDRSPAVLAGERLDATTP
ncbi:MAG: MATE family efflux transporter [Acidobacteriota bacterium]|nr:MAG: MATE family efflux transporter [Acidobacteriota bacterium]